MEKLENNIILQENNIYMKYIGLYKRYLGYIFIACEGTEEWLTSFAQYINTVHNTIKFDMTHNRSRLIFLDIEGKKIGTTIQTDVYRKPTDANSCLAGDSFHPSHLKKEFGLFPTFELRRNCSLDLDFYRKAKELISQLANRGIHLKL